MQNLERPVQKVADKPPLAVPFSIAGHTIKPGERKTIDIPLLVLPDHTPVSFSVHVAHGRKPGPTFFASAAIHGDEIIGVEIVRRLIKSPPIRRVSGTVLLVPIVNTLGFISHSRYLPDRRDLNRSFPGNETGSFASQLAHLMLTEIISRSDFGISL